MSLRRYRFTFNRTLFLINHSSQYASKFYAQKGTPKRKIKVKETLVSFECNKKFQYILHIISLYIPTWYLLSLYNQIYSHIPYIFKLSTIYIYIYVSVIWCTSDNETRICHFTNFCRGNLKIKEIVRVIEPWVEWLGLLYLPSILLMKSKFHFKRFVPS